MLDLAAFLAMSDHTLLTPEATGNDIERLCREAAALTTACVCVHGYWVRRARSLLRDSRVRTCSVVGFPSGAMLTRSIAAETGHVVDAGAQEVDMVIPVGLVKAGEYTAAAEYVRAARRSAPATVLKVILETAVLTTDEIRRACRLCVDEGADFVKTSTGFHPAGGATAAAVHTMRETVGPDVGVKAAGGIRSLADVERMVQAGANRLGLSHTLRLARELGWSGEIPD